MADQDLAYDVEHLKSGKIIGYKWGSDPGGLVYDVAGNVVGALMRGVARNEWILSANQPHHTGKQYDGDSALWSNRPSKRFN